jgi:hypothetical protein
MVMTSFVFFWVMFWTSYMMTLTDWWATSRTLNLRRLELQPNDTDVISLNMSLWVHQSAPFKIDYTEFTATFASEAGTDIGTFLFPAYSSPP